MATKKLDLYKLGVVLDVDSAKGISALKATDKELKAVDQDSKRAEKALGLVGSTLNKLKSFSFGSGGSSSSGLLPGLSQISQIIQGIPQLGNLAHALVSPLKESAEQGIRFNMLIESAEMGFRGVLGGAKESAKYVKQLTDFAAANPIFNTQATIKSARMMSVFGFETRKTTDYLKIWGGAIAAGTGSLDEEKLEGVVTAFGQMRSLGRVSAEDINQLQNRGIPAWEMLARAIGKTVAETRKLSEQGKLNGAGAVDAITAMLDQDPRFAGQVDNFANTLEGLIAQGEDTREVAQGRATQELTASIKRSYQAALTGDNQQLIQTMADGINSAIKPVAGLIETALTTALTGGVSSVGSQAVNLGLKLANPFKHLGYGAITSVAEGAKEAGGQVVTTIKDVADSGQQSLRDAWQQNSPSVVFYNLGFGAMKSLRKGLLDGGLGATKTLTQVLQDGTGGATDQFRETIERIKAEFERITGRKLRGVIGQTATHTRLNFDHSQGADLAVAPGTADARLVERLAAQYGIPVLRQPGARRNSRGRVTSTGAHLHLGRLSPNLDRSDAYLVSEASASPEMQGGAGVKFNAGRAMPVTVVNLAELRGMASRDLFEHDNGIDLTKLTPLPKTPAYDPKGNIIGYDSGDPVGELPTGTLKTFKDFLAIMPPLAGVLPEAARKTKLTLGTTEVAIGSFAKSVIMANRDLKGAFAGIAGLMPQQQVGQKRGFFSKLLGVAAPFLGFIPGVGPLLSTLAGMGSAAAGGDWGSVLTQGVTGFSSGGAFRRTGSSSAPLAPQGVNFTNPATRLPGRARGGPVSRGRAYVVGEHRAEVFTPEDDGWIHPSVDAFSRRQGSGGGAGGGEHGIWARLEAFLQQNIEMTQMVHNKFSAMPPEHMVATVARSHPQIFGEGLMRAGSRDPQVIDWMRRRTT